MVLAICAFFLTVIVGFFADGLLASAMNWPDAGAVFAVATMGAFLLWSSQRKTNPTD